MIRCKCIEMPSELLRFELEVFVDKCTPYFRQQDDGRGIVVNLVAAAKENVFEAASDL
jgi:hypothetical protein